MEEAFFFICKLDKVFLTPHHGPFPKEKDKKAEKGRRKEEERRNRGVTVRPQQGELIF